MRSLDGYAGNRTCDPWISISQVRFPVTVISGLVCELSDLRSLGWYTNPGIAGPFFRSRIAGPNQIADPAPEIAGLISRSRDRRSDFPLHTNSGIAGPISASPVFRLNLSSEIPSPVGWSGGAKVLGKLPVPGRPTILITVGQGPTALAVGAGGGCLDIFTLIYPFSFSLSLGDGPI